MRTRSNTSIAYPHAMSVVCPVQFIHVWVNTIVVVCSLSLCDQDSVWKSQFILVWERNMLGELAYGQFLVDFERCSFVSAWVVRDLYLCWETALLWFIYFMQTRSLCGVLNLSSRGLGDISSFAIYPHAS